MEQTLALDFDDDDFENSDNEGFKGFLIQVKDDFKTVVKEHRLESSLITIGRDPKANMIVIDNTTISRKHAELEIESETEAFVTDLKSQNRTFIRRASGTKPKLLKPHRPAAISSGAFVTFGEVNFQFFHADDRDEPSPEPSPEHDDLPNTIAYTDDVEDNNDDLAATIAYGDDANEEDDLPNTIAYNDEEEDDESKQDELAATMLYTDDGDDAAEDLPQTIAYEDEPDEDDKLAATIAYDQNDNENDDDLAATIAYDANDSENGDLAATIAYDDNNDDPLGDLDATIAYPSASDSANEPELAATIAYDAVDSPPSPNLEATVAYDLPDKEASPSPDLAATIAYKDMETDDDLEPTMKYDDEGGDADVLPATVAYGDGDVSDDDLAPTVPYDMGNDKPSDDELEATVAYDDASDADGGCSPTLPYDAIESRPAKPSLNRPRIPSLSGVDMYGQSSGGLSSEPQIFPATIQPEVNEPDDELEPTLAYEADIPGRKFFPATVPMEVDDNKELPDTVPMNKVDEDEDDLPPTDIDTESEAQTEPSSYVCPPTLPMAALPESDDDELTQSPIIGTSPVLPKKVKAVVAPPQPPKSPPKQAPKQVGQADEGSETTENDDEPEPEAPPPKPRRARRPRKRSVLASSSDSEDEVKEEKPSPVRRSNRLKKKLSVAEPAASPARPKRQSKAKTKVKAKPASKKQGVKRGRKASGKVRGEPPKKKPRLIKKIIAQKTPPSASPAAAAVVPPAPVPVAKKPKPSPVKRGRKRSRIEDDNAESKPLPKRRKRKLSNKSADDDAKVADVSSPASASRSRKRRASNNKNSPPSKKRRLAADEQPKHVVVLRTGMEFAEQDRALEELGATVLSEYDDSVTHLISEIPRRTLKFICAMSNAQHIVTDRWAAACVTRGSFDVQEDSYFPRGRETKQVEKQFKFNLKRSFGKARISKVFDGMKLYCCGDLDAAFKKAMWQMFEANGGEIVKTLTAVRKIKDGVIAISKNKNSKTVKQLRKDGVGVFNHNIVVTSVLRQSIDYADPSFAIS